MFGVTVFRGPYHILKYQSELFIRLMGSHVGLPAREAFCDRGRFVPYFKMFDDVYETGIELEVRTPSGVLWIFRLEDQSGIAVHYEREPSLPLPAPRMEPFLLVPVG